MKIGTIVEWPSNTLPDETFLFAHGQAVSRITYADLFSVIGTTYGAGDGSTTFNVPDYRDRVPVGLDTNDSDFNVLGKTGGEKTHTLNISEMAPHNHVYGYSVRTFMGSGNPGVEIAPNISASGSSSENYVFETGGSANNTPASSTPFNVLQPYIVTNYIIKALNPDSIKISELESASSVTSSDVLPIVQNGETKKVEFSTIKEDIQDDINNLVTTLNISQISETTSTSETELARYTIVSGGLYLLTGALLPNYYGASGRTLTILIKKNNTVIGYYTGVINASAFTLATTICTSSNFNTNDILSITITNSGEGQLWALSSSVLNLIKLK